MYTDWCVFRHGYGDRRVFCKVRVVVVFVDHAQNDVGKRKPNRNAAVGRSDGDVYPVYLFVINTTSHDDFAGLGIQPNQIRGVRGGIWEVVKQRSKPKYYYLLFT